MRALRYAWLAVPVVGLLELGAYFAFAARAPRPERWQDVKPLVEGVATRGDLVVVAPEWAEPNARFALGDEWMPVRDVARPDVTAYARAVEVSILGAWSDELAGWKTLEERASGGFVVRLRENPSPARVLYDFTDHLNGRDAEVSIRQGDRVEPCPWNARARVTAGGLGGPPTAPKERFDCPSASTLVGVTVIDDERYEPRRCIWARPPASGRLRVELADVPLGRTIRGYTGLPWVMARDLAGESVTIEVRVDERVAGRVVHSDGDGWKLFEVPTGQEGKSATVAFDVLGAPSASRRELCFHADTR